MSIVKHFNGNVLSSAKFVETFKKYDKDGNGVIEASELDTFLKDLRDYLEEQCDIKTLKKQVLAKYDTNNDGKISMDEMKKILPTEENILIQLRKVVRLTSVDFMKIWYHYDLDKSGYLEESEINGFIHDFLEKNGDNVNSAKFEQGKAAIVDTIDTDKDGKISLSELFELLPVEENFFRKFAKRQSLNDNDFAEIFKKYDKDANGLIEEEEIMALLKDIQERDGQKPDMADLEAYKEELMKVIDTNNDGKISKEELAMFLSEAE